MIARAKPRPARKSSGGATPMRAVPANSGLTAHETVYRTIRDIIFAGGMQPGMPVTLRGLAETLDVSVMPVREAVRRLIAERALVMQDNRRVLVPEMDQDRFGQIVFARQTLEPELAARALRNFQAKDIRALEAVDRAIDRAMAKGDVDSYMRGNCDFHFMIYRLAKQPVLLGLVESVWLQFAPFMRIAYGHYDTTTLEDFHQAAIKAMVKGKENDLRSAIAADITQGMSLIGEDVLSEAVPGRSSTT